MKPAIPLLSILRSGTLLLISCTWLLSCHPVDLYERTTVIPGHSWKSSFKPSFDFTIQDTAAAYNVFLVLRHSDKYDFNNIYVNIGAKQPGTDSAQKVRYDLRLGSDAEGWLGTGMDDIYEHRILLTPKDQRFYFRKPGTYTFTVEQLMREDPLLHVLNVGIRIEKLP